MKRLHELRLQNKKRLSPPFFESVPEMIQTIEQEWRYQNTAGTCSFRQRLLLQQAHVALCSLVEFREEAP